MKIRKNVRIIFEEIRYYFGETGPEGLCATPWQPFRIIIFLMKYNFMYLLPVNCTVLPISETPKCVTLLFEWPSYFEKIAGIAAG